MPHNITNKLSNDYPSRLFGEGLRTVIRYFIEHTHGETYQLQLVHALRQRVRQTQYHLGRLTKAGFLISRPTRYRHYYRLNKRWPYLRAFRKLFS